MKKTKMTAKDASRIQRSVANSNNGEVPKKSFGARATSAGAKNSKANSSTTKTNKNG